MPDEYGNLTLEEKGQGCGFFLGLLFFSPIIIGFIIFTYVWWTS